MATIKIKDGDVASKYYQVNGAGTVADPYRAVTDVAFRDSANLDAFSRLRVSQPTTVFDAQLTYDLQPTIFEQITNGTGATVVHEATERAALMTFASTPTGGKAFMQTFEHFRYQPLKSQLVAVTFNFIEAKANVLKFAGYSDGVNGIEFQNNGTDNQFVIYSGTSNGNQTITQANWNLDKLDGTGLSGITLDITKTQIAIIDFQALYVGRVRVGFDIDGSIVYVHEFNHSNIVTQPYIQTANLPIRCGMTSTNTVSTTMYYYCSAIASEGGQELTASYDFARSNNVTAGNGTDTHLLSIRPRTTFNGIVNRAKVVFVEIEIMVTGANPVEWSLVVGQALTTPSFANVNTTYSTMDADTSGTLSGSPAIIVNKGFVSATSQVKGASASYIRSRYPITLDAAGAVRDLGTLTLLVKGIGGTSVTYGCIKWLEVR
jgi:hypothetical protein